MLETINKGRFASRFGVGPRRASTRKCTRGCLFRDGKSDIVFRRATGSPFAKLLILGFSTTLFLLFLPAIYEGVHFVPTLTILSIVTKESGEIRINIHFYNEQRCSRESALNLLRRFSSLSLSLSLSSFFFQTRSFVRERSFDSLGNVFTVRTDRYL